MDLLSVRQKLVAGNVANANTPGYHTKDIDFQREYSSLVQGGSPHVIELEDLKGKNDGNNVSIDREARLMAENAIRFAAASTLLKAQMRAVRSAIKEGSTG